MSNTAVPHTWAKFKPIMDANKRSRISSLYYADFEYLALEVAKMMYRVDSSYRGNMIYYEKGSWERAFPSLFKSE